MGRGSYLLGENCGLGWGQCVLGDGAMDYG